MFAVRGDVPGLGYGPRARTMGWRASTNAEVFIDDVFVPDHDVIGDVGTGFAGAVRTFELSRIEVAACSIGVARARWSTRATTRTSARRSGVHRPLPGRQLSAGRCAHPSPRLAAPDVGRCALRRPGRTVRHQGVDGQALRLRECCGHHESGDAGVGRTWLRRRPSDREVVPRRRWRPSKKERARSNASSSAAPCSIRPHPLF